MSWQMENHEGLVMNVLVIKVNNATETRTHMRTND